MPTRKPYDLRMYSDVKRLHGLPYRCVSYPFANVTLPKGDYLVANRQGSVLNISNNVLINGQPYNQKMNVSSFIMSCKDITTYKIVSGGLTYIYTLDDVDIIYPLEVPTTISAVRDVESLTSQKVTVTIVTQSPDTQTVPTGENLVGKLIVLTDYAGLVNGIYSVTESKLENTEFGAFSLRTILTCYEV